MVSRSILHVEKIKCNRLIFKAAGPVKITEPLTLGHESAGRIAKIGSKVTLVSVGDRVAIEPNQPCRKCRICKAGKSELCSNGLNCGLPVKLS